MREGEDLKLIPCMMNGIAVCRNLGKTILPRFRDLPSSGKHKTLSNTRVMKASGSPLPTSVCSLCGIRPRAWTTHRLMSGTTCWNQLAGRSLPSQVWIWITLYRSNLLEQMGQMRTIICAPKRCSERRSHRGGRLGGATAGHSMRGRLPKANSLGTFCRKVLGLRNTTCKGMLYMRNPISSWQNEASLTRHWLPRPVREILPVTCPSISIAATIDQSKAGRSGRLRDRDNEELLRFDGLDHHACGKGHCREILMSEAASLCAELEPYVDTSASNDNLRWTWFLNAGQGIVWDTKRQKCTCAFENLDKSIGIFFSPVHVHIISQRACPLRFTCVRLPFSGVQGTLRCVSTPRPGCFGVQKKGDCKRKT